MSHYVRTGDIYGKCSKVWNFFHFIFTNKMLLNRTGVNKMLVRIANREDPDQTASSEAVWSGSALFVRAFCHRQLVFAILEHLPYMIYDVNFSVITVKKRQCITAVGTHLTAA